MVTQDTSLLHRSIRDNIRYGRPDATEAEIVAAAQAGAGPRLHPRAGGLARPARLRRPCRRARRQALRRPAPAHRHRPRDPEGRADPGARRGDLRARQRGRGRDPGEPRHADGRQDRDRHRAPALDHRAHGPAGRARPRPHRRAGHARRAAARSAATTPSCGGASPAASSIPRRRRRRRNKTNHSEGRIMTKAVFYQSIGPELARYDIDVDGAALIRRDAVTTPGANVQYVWPHPSKKFLYVVSSDGGPGTIPGTRHIATAFRIDPASGALTPHGGTAPLPSRPVHCSVDRSRRISADRLQLSEQHHGPSHQAGRHARRAGRAARKTRRRHFRASGPDHAGQPDRDHGDARQQSRRRASPRTPARSRSMASRTACCRISLRSSAATGSASARAISTFIRASLGCSSRSSGRASCTSIDSTTTARCRATRCSSRTRWPTAPTTSTRRWPAPSTFIRTAGSST